MTSIRARSSRLIVPRRAAACGEGSIRRVRTRRGSSRQRGGSCLGPGVAGQAGVGPALLGERTRRRRRFHPERVHVRRPPPTQRRATSTARASGSRGGTDHPQALPVLGPPPARCGPPRDLERRTVRDTSSGTAPALVSCPPSRRRCSNCRADDLFGPPDCWLRVGSAMNICSTASVKLPASAALRSDADAAAHARGAPATAFGSVIVSACPCFMSSTYAAIGDCASSPGSCLARYWDRIPGFPSLRIGNERSTPSTEPSGCAHRTMPGDGFVTTGQWKNARRLTLP